MIRKFIDSSFMLVVLVVAYLVSIQLVADRNELTASHRVNKTTQAAGVGFFRLPAPRTPAEQARLDGAPTPTIR